MTNKFLTVAIPTTNATVVRVRKSDANKVTRQQHDKVALARAIRGGKRATDFQAEGQLGFHKKNHQWTLTR